MTFWSPGPLCGEGNSTANARSEDTATIASRIALAREEFRLDHFASDLAFHLKLNNYKLLNYKFFTAVASFDAHPLLLFAHFEHVACRSTRQNWWNPIALLSENR